jgi:hypothetical protein
VREDKIEKLTEHLNSVEPTGNIKFTYETENEGKLPFLDMLIKRQEDNSLHLEVYRKKTHTDQYLMFDSHHPLHHKLGVVRTLLDRANNIISNEEAKDEEEKHIKKALKTCGYPAWTITKTKQNIKRKEDKNKKQSKKTTSGKQQTNNVPRTSVTLPYVQGLTERVSRTLRKFNVNVGVKPGTTIRQLLVHPKDKVIKEKTAEVVYVIPCKNCKESYVGETSRQLGVRVKEHRVETEKLTKDRNFTRQKRKDSETKMNKSAITDHATSKNHVIDWEATTIRTKEGDWHRRGIAEAINIRTTPNFNRDEGRFHLPHLWDSLLQRRTETGRPRGRTTTTTAPSAPPIDGASL